MKEPRFGRNKTKTIFRNVQKISTFSSESASTGVISCGENIPSTYWKYWSIKNTENYIIIGTELATK